MSIKRKPVPIQKPSLLLNLPAELRIQIYSHLWGEDTLKFAGQRTTIVAKARRGEDVNDDYVEPKLPLWLQTCRQICREGIEQLAKTRRICAVPVSRRWEGSTGSTITPKTLRIGLVRPFVTTVLLDGALGRANDATTGASVCWHEHVTGDLDMEYCAPRHPVAQAQLRFHHTSNQGTKLQRTYHISIGSLDVSLLSSLLKMGAPIREVILGCRWGNDPRDGSKWCFKDKLDPAPSQVKETEELASLLKRGLLHDATMLHQSWNVKIYRADFRFADKDMSVYYYRSYPLRLRWTRDGRR